MFDHVSCIGMDQLGLLCVCSHLTTLRKVLIQYSKEITSLDHLIMYGAGLKILILSM